MDGRKTRRLSHTAKAVATKITLNYPKPAAMGFFPRDTRASLKQP